MKTPNRHPIVPGMRGPHNDNDDDDDEDLRALTSVDLDDDDTPRYWQGGRVIERVPEAGATRQNSTTRSRRQRVGSKGPGSKGPG